MPAKPKPHNSLTRSSQWEKAIRACDEKRTFSASTKELPPEDDIDAISMSLF